MGRWILKAAQWCEGGKLEWASGGSSLIAAFTPGKMVKIKERWKSTTYTFELNASGKTIVRIQSSPSEEVYYSNGGAAESARLRLCLDNLKKHIEKIQGEPIKPEDFEKDMFTKGVKQLFERLEDEKNGEEKE